MDHFWLTDEQFAKIAPHLPTDTRGKARVDDRRVISGIIHVLKSGGRWTDAPGEIYGPKLDFGHSCGVAEGIGPGRWQAEAGFCSGGSAR